MKAFVIVCAAVVCLSLLSDGLWPESWEEPLDHALQAAGDLLIDLGEALKEVRLFGPDGPRENRAQPEAGDPCVLLAWDGDPEDGAGKALERPSPPGGLPEAVRAVRILGDGGNSPIRPGAQSAPGRGGPDSPEE